MNFELAENQIIQIGSGPDALHHAARHICERCAGQLPDLSDAAILTPLLQAGSELLADIQAQAMQQGFQALLLPRVMTLQQFAALHVSPPPQRVVPESERLLILVDELRNHPTLYGSGSPWLLAENLLQLFDELVLNQLELPQSTEGFIEQLAQAYRVPAQNLSLQREARLVQTLWQAWHAQLQNEGLLDPTLHYLQQLTGSLEKIDSKQTVFVLGLLEANAAEQQWLKKLANRCRLTVLRTGNGAATQVIPELGLCDAGSEPSAPAHAFFHTCYNWKTDSLIRRITDFRATQPRSPVSGRLFILGVDHFEQQAQATALFVRSALAQHAEHAGRVGIVCEDRLLARRIRALLERSNVILHDSVGWALSTTRAAAVLESWLECIELDFQHEAFLDLLKSPLTIQSENDPILKLIYRFENDIVLHENINSGLNRYKQAIGFRAKRLAHWSNKTGAELLSLLDYYRQAAKPLQSLLNGKFTLGTALDLLITSLQQIARTPFFQNDAAADLLMQTLLKLQAASRMHAISVTWTELRNWLGRAMETEYFRPEETDGDRRVILISLQQSFLQNFDALIVAAADEQHLPGNMEPLPFFNQSVRAALGLPDHSTRLRINETRFRTLLQNSQSALLLWQKQLNGEPVEAGHWVSALELFHKQVYGESLEPAALKQWLHQSELVPAEQDAAVPVSITQQPSSSVGAVEVPQELSAGAHQRLINCPYQFYIQDILKLKPLDEVREALQKSDYGSLVHTSLEAFHIGIDKLPGPFMQAINAETRDAAVQALADISRQVFSKDIEDNFQHRAWLQRWLDFIPHYIDWQIEHSAGWEIVAGEKRADVALAGGINLRGRIDRIEKQADAINLIDYKTGVLPKLDEITSGEEVQLVSYSLLLEHVNSVQYIGIDGRAGVDDKNTLAGDELKTLQTAVKERLVDVMNRIRSNAAMPAHGDEITCGYCDAKGICRRAAWK
jgi:ATP-dependent helicase/nuclease subunit B